MRATRALVLVLLAVCASGVLGKISHREVSRDARNLIQIEMPFGFASRGIISLQLKGVQTYQAQITGDGNIERKAEKGRLGFFIVPSKNDVQELHEDYLSGTCYLDDKTSVEQLFTFGDDEVKDKIEKKEVFSFEHPMQGKPGEYSLYFANCDQHTLVSFKLRVEMYSVYGEGSKMRKDYLSVGEQELPTLYLIMFLAFAGLGVMWSYLCVKERATVHSIHHLMFVLILLRALTLFTQAGMFHYDRVSGNPEGWNIAYYVFTFFRGIMFFTLVVLIGTGWSYLRPFIGEKEKKILVVVIPLQVFANIAIVYLDETSPVRTTFFTWKDMFHFVDIICCCAILFPIVWSIKHLREGAETDGKAAANIEKLTLFRQFYIMVVVYIYFTRIIVYMLENMVPYDLKWTSSMAAEIATLIFYVLTGMKFRPHQENKYFKLDSAAV
ncbi:hypothetical protein BSKO_07625 [Bryopsis sp. KO-2023]|nr:hypothetical protein BSKO_07625 [Bryopsis sp. KO-2023]